MRFTHLSSPLCATLLVLAGCQIDQAAQSPDMTNTDTTAISYGGDFDGPLGLQLWSMRDYTEEDLPGTLQRVHDMGFREVELAGTYGRSPAEFRELLDAAGLQATSMHASYDLLRDSLESVLDDAETLGVSYVGIAWIPHDEEQGFDQTMARQTADDFNRFGEAATARGLTFFYHTHGFEFQADGQGVTPFDVLVAETDPENVKFEMDVFWTVLPGADPVALLRRYPDRWELMHVKDMKQGWPLGDHSGGAPAEADVPVGTGQIDYKAVLQAAEEIGLSKYYIEDESPAPLENIPASIAYLEGVRY